MSTSGSVDFAVTRDDLVKYALMQIGVVGEGETPTSAQYTEGSFILNMLTKARMADGMPLWALKTGYILPVTGVNVLGLGTTGHTVTAYTQTTTSADAAASASTITITATTGFAASQPIGIELDDGTMHWTTINGALSGSTVTLTTALASAAASGNTVYTYVTTNRITRPLRILSAQIVTPSDSTRHPINIITREEYNNLGGGTSASEPNQVYYDPQVGTGNMYFYPRFYGGDKLMQISFHRPYEDFDATADNPDFPQEWYLSLWLDLAALLGGKYGVPITERQALKAEAKEWRELALSNGTEEGSFFFQPSWETIRGR